MTALLDAIARAFIAPATADARREAVVVAAVPSTAVCGPGAGPLACALALLVRRRGPAAVCLWGAAARQPAAPATAGARRLAASMAARGLVARASGRLVKITLDDAPAVAAAEAARACAAAGDAPVVLALCAPRDPAFDDLLGQQDVAVVACADAPQELVRVGIAVLEDTCRRAVAAPAPGAAAAWAAEAGLCALPGARRALATATGALR